MNGSRSYKPREPGSVKEAVDLLFGQVGRKRVGVVLDLGPAQVAAFTDERTKEQLSIARGAALSSPDATALAEYFALLCKGAFLPVTPEQADLSTLCADDLRAHGEATAVIVSALKDGKLNRAEAVAAKVKVRDALRALTGLYTLIDSKTKQDAAGS